MDNADKLDTVTEIHIKGWKLERPIIEVLSLCLPAIDNLNTLKWALLIKMTVHHKFLLNPIYFSLWNAGLDEESIRLISSILPNCNNLKYTFVCFTNLQHRFEILLSKNSYFGQ
jgi:hypothetical protein